MAARIAIIGGGAAGMTAAITAARTAKGNCEIILIEHTDRLGKKILATGNGKCNLTNRNIKQEFYRGNNPEFAMKALGYFGFEDTIHFFNDMGLMVREKNGYFYPYSEQAAVVNDVLRLEVERFGIKVMYETKVERISNEKGSFSLVMAGGKKLVCDKLIIATGSKASPKTGSDGSGYTLAKGLGHKVIKPLPALVQLICKESFYKSIAGVRADAKVTVEIEGNVISERGELQLTDYGISGIPVFQVSRYVVGALDKKLAFTTYIDFLPDIAHKELMDFFKRQAKLAGKTVEEVLNGFMNKKLSVLIAKECRLSPNAEFARVKDKEFYVLIDKIKNFKVEVTGSKSFDMAQVCQGGVDTAELSAPTMESKLCKGLYFAGEIIDIDGACGGYNLQWAWTSGYLAGKSAAEGLNK
ncbi:MAG: NAD(P)/FAD-dependent oxidoreductase [Lachnospiraceae bacterium]|nr:NAD(P)/FAD-dependent oxidoreductase [Lachnospiraceae bacterium]